MTARANWRDDAACREADPDLFFPVGTTGPALRQVDEAKRICRSCPAQTACLAWALGHEITDGVWGGTTEDERRALRDLLRRTTTSQEDDDSVVISARSMENMEYVRRLLKRKQPGFSAALELAADRVRQGLGGPGFLPEAQLPGVYGVRIGDRLYSGFSGDFAAADGERVVVAAPSRRQFADLAKTTRLARTFAFLERLLDADFSACGDLHAHRDTIASLLAPWFARRTVTDLAAAFAGTSVPWARATATSPIGRGGSSAMPGT